MALGDVIVGSFGRGAASTGRAAWVYKWNVVARGI